MAVILLVDNEEIVIQMAAIALERAGHTVHTAKSGVEADRIAAELSKIDVLVVDHRIDGAAKFMAPENGRAIAERLVRRHRDVKVMHISGYPRAHLAAEGSLFPGGAYLAKPFTLEQMQHSVAALAAYQNSIGGSGSQRTG